MVLHPERRSDLHQEPVWQRVAAPLKPAWMLTVSCRVHSVGLALVLIASALVEHVPADHLLDGSTSDGVAWSYIANASPEALFANGEFVWMRDLQFGSRNDQRQRLVELGFRVDDAFMGEGASGQTVSVWAWEHNIAYSGTCVARWAVRNGVQDSLGAEFQRADALSQRLATVQWDEQLRRAGQSAEAVRQRRGRIVTASVRLGWHGHPRASAPHLFYEVGGVIAGRQPYLLMMLSPEDEGIARQIGLPGRGVYFLDDIYWGRVVWGDEATKLWDALPKQHHRIERLRAVRRQSSFR